MTAKFNYIVCSIEESKNIDTLSIDELQSSLLEEEVSLLMVCHTKEKTYQDLWYLGTGCSNYMCGDKNAFSDLDESFQNTVKFRDESTGNSTHSISSVFFIPDLKTNLLSIVDYFRVFGCIAHIAAEKRKKLDNKGEKCFFFFVSDQSKAYKLYNPITKKIIISRDVVFDEERTWSWNINIVEQCIPTTFDGNGREIMQQHLHHLVPAGPVLEIPQNQVPPAAAEANEQVDTTFHALNVNNTWELTDLPKGHKTIGVKWVYKTKLKENGKVDKYKACLVAKGYRQEFGVDYKEIGGCIGCTKLMAYIPTGCEVSILTWRVARAGIYRSTSWLCEIWL
ncbi:hypothetical protein ACOSQ4_019932 [Xanthoceras sorbifolium]